MKRLEEGKLDKSKRFAFKTKNFIITETLLEEINNWSEEIHLQMSYSKSPLIKKEIYVRFAFKTEKDLSMFMLRWIDVLEHTYKNTVSYKLHQLQQQIDVHYKNKNNN